MDVAEKIKEYGLIAIVRGNYSLNILESIAYALLEGGIRVIEITLNSQGALAGIELLEKKLGEHLLLGAGTVRTVNDVDRACAAGAQFLVSPNLDPKSVSRSLEKRVLQIPGIVTPTEAQSAFEAGCHLVKLFPANIFGPKYLKALRAPLNDIDFIPTGGIELNNIEEYVRAGGAALAIGSALVKGKVENYSELSEKANRFVNMLKEVRAGLGRNMKC